MHVSFTTQHGTMSLPELLSAISAGDPVELLRMRPHQRVPIVTALAVIMVALQRYASTPPESPSDWAVEWSHQVGDDALRLVAPENEVAFFQPPLGSGRRSDLTLSDLDLTFAKAAHAIKPVANGAAEEAILALLSGATGLSVIHWNGTTRQMLSAVLASDDGTLGGEVRHVVNAYGRGSESVLGPGRSAADHLLWLKPSSEHGLSLDQVPYPYVEARPYHLREVSPGRYAGVGEQDVAFRFAGKPQPHADDPHVALIDGRPYRLWAGRVWKISTQYELVFGSARTTRPRALSIPGYRVVRICGLGVDQGKTLGYWEATYPLTPRAAFSLASHSDRASALSQRALDTADEGSRALRYAASALVDSDALRSRAGSMLLDALTTLLTARVLALIGAEPDPAGEQKLIAGTVASAMQTVWAQICVGYDAFSVAVGTDRLFHRIHQFTGESDTMERPQLARQIYTLLSELTTHLTPNDRATLRTALATQPPLLYWSLLGQVPERLRQTPETESVWRATLPLLGTCRPGGVPVGRALATTDYPEMRVRQLIGATGTTLISITTEVCRWLLAHEETRIDLTALIALGLADAIGDARTREQIRQHIALDYVRRHAKHASLKAEENKEVT